MHQIYYSEEIKPWIGQRSWILLGMLSLPSMLDIFMDPNWFVSLVVFSISWAKSSGRTFTFFFRSCNSSFSSCWSTDRATMSNICRESNHQKHYKKRLLQEQVEQRPKKLLSLKQLIAGVREWVQWTMCIDWDMESNNESVWSEDWEWLLPCLGV